MSVIIAIVCIAITVFLMTVANGIILVARETGSTLRSRLSVVLLVSISLFLILKASDLESTAYEYGTYIIPVMLLTGFVGRALHHILEVANLISWGRVAALSAYVIYIYAATFDMYGLHYQIIMMGYTLFFIYTYIMIEEEIEEEKYHRENTPEEDKNW